MKIISNLMKLFSLSWRSKIPEVKWEDLLITWERFGGHISKIKRYNATKKLLYYLLVIILLYIYVVYIAGK